MDRRRPITAGLVSGAANWRASSLAPAAVTVLSSTDTSDPARPDADENTSSPRRVGASISIVSPMVARRGGSIASGNWPTVAAT